MVGGGWNEEAPAIWSLVAAEGRCLLLPRAPEEDGPVERGTCEPGGRRIDFFVASAALAGRMGVETIMREALLQPQRPVKLDVTVGGPATLVPMLDTPKPFLMPDDPLPVGPRPSGEGAWAGRTADWEAGLAAGDLEALWRSWCESWLVGWTGKTDPNHFGRGRVRRIRRLPAEGQRGPVGLGEAGKRAQGWLKAWTWLQELSRAVTQGGVVAELKVRRLLLEGACPTWAGFGTNAS